MTDFDVVVIGAGAAGIAAGVRLAAAGVSLMIVEARSRRGGRAWTETRAGFPLDLGCGWLHAAERNPWAVIADELGFTVDRTRPPWGRQAFADRFSLDDQEAYQRESAAFDARLAEAARRGPDRPASDLLTPGNRWNGLLDAVSTWYSGAELARISTSDYDAYREDAVNWRVAEGFGAVVARHGEGLPVRLGVEARLIDHAGAAIRVETTAGTLTARVAIVTVPTAVLASEAIRFCPALPAKAEAAAALPLGLADKLVLRLARPEELRELPADSHLFGATDRVATGSYHLRPFGRPLIECFFGGELARALERDGEAGFAALALDELAGHLGGGVRACLEPLASTAWAGDPLAGGSYSYARPGGAGARAALAAPVDGRLLFAGEATSLHDFSTAHGAFESGRRAAGEALAALGVAAAEAR